MSDAKHTPRPWQAGLDLPWVANNDPDPRLVWSNSLLVADFRSSWISREVAVANARVGAASLDLLEACLAMLGTWGSDDEDAIIEARDKARDAVTKAMEGDGRRYPMSPDVAERKKPGRHTAPDQGRPRRPGRPNQMRPHYPGRPSDSQPYTGRA